MIVDENNDDDIGLDTDYVNPPLSQLYKDNTLWKDQSISHSATVLVPPAV